MKETYEGRITAEIRRTLRNLYEACEEQQISMQDALNWYLARIVSAKEAEKQEISSCREKAEKFVNKYLDNEENINICVTVLAFMAEHEKNPGIKNVLEEVKAKKCFVYINERDVKYKVCKAFTTLLCRYRGREVDYEKSQRCDDWTNMGRDVFKIAKSL